MPAIADEVRSYRISPIHPAHFLQTYHLRPATSRRSQLMAFGFHPHSLPFVSPLLLRIA